MARQKNEQKQVTKPFSASNKWLQGKRLYAMIIFAASFLLYFNTLFNDYNLDDELVTQNHWLTSKGWDALKPNFEALGGGEIIEDGIIINLTDSTFTQRLKYFLPIIFRVPYYKDNAGFKYEYRPLVFASFALEHALFSKKTITNGGETETDSAGISHFINVLLYSILCVLLFLILYRLFQEYSIIFPFLVSLLFLAYPMHTEDIASIKNRDEILALIFGLLSLNFSLSFIGKNRIGYLLPVLLFFICGILSKPTSITFALLIPLCVVFFRKISFGKLVLLATTLIVPAVFYSRVYTAIQQIELAFLLYAAVTTLFILKNRNTFGAICREKLQDVYSYFKSNTSSDSVSPQALNFKSLQNALPLLLIITGAIVPAIISTYGLFLRDAWLACLPFIFMCVLYILATNELKLVFITPLSLVALFALIMFPHHSGVIEIGLIVFLASQIFSGQRMFRIVGIINYIIFSLVFAIVLHSSHFLFIVFFGGLINRKLFIPFLVVLAASLIVFIKKSFGVLHSGAGPWNITLLLPVLYVFIFLLWKGKWKPAINSTAALLPISLIVYFSLIHPVPGNDTLLKAKGIYHRINSIKAADPAPVQSVRPLNYLEFPLTNKDPLSLRFGTAMEVLGKYFKMVLIPYPMSYYYGYSVIKPQHIAGFIPIMGLLIHLLLLGTAIYFFSKQPILSFALLFYLISIAVFSDLITPIPGMIADRFLLIPSIGFCILVVYGCGKLFKQSFEDASLNLNSLQQPLKISLGVILVLYSGLTFSRNLDWKDRVTLFRHDIKVVENSAQAQNLLGVHLLLLSSHETDRTLQKQLREEALPHFKKALEIYPQFLNASYDLGRTYEALQMNDEALAQYQTTVKIDTHFVAPYFNIATILHNKGQYEGSIPMYQKFLTQYPKQLEAYTNLSFAYFQLKDFERSIATNRLAIQVTGNVFYPTVNIAKTFTVMGQTDSALFYFEQAHAIQPNDAGVNYNINNLKSKSLGR